MEHEEKCSNASLPKSSILTQSLCGPDGGQLAEDVKELLQVSANVSGYQWQDGRYHQYPNGEHHHVIGLLSKGRGEERKKLNSY